MPWKPKSTFEKLKNIPKFLFLVHHLPPFSGQPNRNKQKRIREKERKRETSEMAPFRKRWRFEGSETGRRGGVFQIGGRCERGENEATRHERLSPRLQSFAEKASPNQSSQALHLRFSWGYSGFETFLSFSYKEGSFTPQRHPSGRVEWRNNIKFRWFLI